MAGEVSLRSHLAFHSRSRPKISSRLGLVNLRRRAADLPSSSPPLTMLAALSLSPAYTLPSSGGAPSSAQPSASSLPPCMAAAAAAADPAEHEAKVAKALKAMTGFANSYVKNTKTKYCAELSIPSVVLKGLAEHKVALGAPLCPCRHYEDKQAEAKDGYWNCPCVPMRERHECHCMLFLPEEHGFAGDSDHIDLPEVEELTANFKPPPQ